MDECYPEAICGDCALCEPWTAAGAPQGAVALGTNVAPEWIVTTAGYSPEEQAAYCANYCAGVHHPACARRTMDGCC